MNWIKNISKKIKPKISNLFKKKSLAPDDFWASCPSCSSVIDRNDIKNNFYCCTKCNEPQQIFPRQRFEMLFDNGEYTELKSPKVSSDPLQWSDTKKYSDKVKAARKKFDQDNAAVVAAGSINSLPVVSYCLNQKFLGGSVGLEEGAAFVFACEEAIRTRSSLIAFPSTGGQKMQLSIFGLMMMPQSIIALQELEKEKLPVIIMAVSPVSGGVTASWVYGPSVFLFAESERTKIMFAGPRVIEKTISEQLPPDFQTAGLLLKKGFVDRIIPRKKHREEFSNLISILLHKQINKEDSLSDAQRQDTIHTKSTLSA